MLQVFAGTARAQNLNLGSSMTATCVGANGCDQVAFVLTVDNNPFVDIVRLFSGDATQWQFGGVASVTDANNQALNWAWGVDNGGVTVWSAGSFSPSPITITVNMSTFSSGGIGNGLITYNGQANTQQDGRGTGIDFQGSVTPEPVSVALLGTGLLGLAGVRSRRRKEETTET